MAHYSYLKCTVTAYSGNVIVYAVTPGKGALIVNMALTNPSVLVEETYCDEESYNKLNWYPEL